MIDFTGYQKQGFLQILKCNSEYSFAIAESKEWSQVVDVIDSLDLKYTEEQLEFVKQKDWE